MTPILAEISTAVWVAIAALAVLALVAVLAAATRRDSNEATGLLSRETQKRDKEIEISPIGVQPAGHEIETIGALERTGAVAVAEKGGTVEARQADLVEYVPPDPETLGVARRQFLNRSIIAFFGLGLAGFGAAVLGFLWPQPKGGFGSKLNVGKIDDIKQKITAGKGFYYVAEGRMWVTAYPASAIEKAKAVYPQTVLNSMEAGLATLYQKCPHLGCRVPSCVTSQWFECPCHGSQYNQAGEKKGGPAPRGMDRFVTEVAGGNLSVDTGTIIQGPPIGTNTTGQEAEGPHCVGGGGH